MRTEFISSLTCSIIAHLILAIILITNVSYTRREIKKNQYVIITDLIPINKINNIKIKSASSAPSKKKLVTKHLKSPTVIQNKNKRFAKATKTREQAPTPKKEKKKYVKLPAKTNKIAKTKIIKKKKIIVKKKKKAMKWDNDVLLKSLIANSAKNKTSNTKTTAADDMFKGANVQYKASIPLSVSEEMAVLSHIRKNWYNKGFAGSSGDLNIKVMLLITLDVDANVVRVKIGQLYGNLSNSVYKAFVESAVRAVYSASPFNTLPKEKYSTWKNLKLNFSPSDDIS